jgi:hypothetical protein
MIPKVIHQMWLHKSKKVPERIFDYIKMMKSKNSHCDHKLWTSDDIPYLESILSESQARGIQILKSRIKNEEHKLNVLMSGIFRIQILNKFGGLYADCDVCANLPFPENIFKKDAFLVIPNFYSKWITDGIFAMKPDMAFVPYISKRYINGFTPAPVLFTNGIMECYGSKEHSGHTSPLSIKQTLKGENIILSTDGMYFDKKAISHFHQPISSHIGLSSWHNRSGTPFKLMSKDLEFNIEDI